MIAAPSIPAERNHTDAFASALAELRELLGKPFVHADANTCQEWARSTLPRGTTPAAIVQPANTEEVQAIVRLAGRHGLPLYPISCGKNWGYTDACAARDGQIIVDLRRMNRILEVNEKLAYAVIEPGVTQGQLAGYLESRGLAVWMDATGAGPAASIVGNVLERGLGHTPHGDRFAHVCRLHVVLADGRLLRTGFGHYAEARGAAVFKWGIGPYLDGLFTQSNFGIVTRMTVWLMPKPEAFTPFLICSPRAEDIGALVEALRPLRLRGTLQTPVHLFNDLRLLAGLDRYPWSEADGKTPVSAEWVEAARRRHGLSAWHGTGACYGSRAEVRAAIHTLRRALRGTPARLLVLSDWKRRLAAGLARVLRGCRLGKTLGFRLERMQVAYDLLRGRPSTACLSLTHWRLRTDVAPNQSLDPLDRNAGVIWLAPVLPATAEDVQRFESLTRPIMNRHGFEYQLTYSFATPRALCAVLTVCYDRTNPEETERARACHDRLHAAVMSAGYVPYRAGNLSMDGLAQNSDVFWNVVAALKAALDPEHRMAPGHYEPVLRPETSDHMEGTRA
jgi:4-cresol dehydrogenase (hydroxylating)